MAGAVVVLVACAPGLDDADTTATDAPSTPIAANRLSLRDDLVDPQVVKWRSWSAVDDTALEFTVTSGPPDCYAARADVVESDTEVKVRLQIGRVPEAADRLCQAIALESLVRVRLTTPLGARRVLPLT